MAAGFLASVILLETLLTDDLTLDQAARAATTDLMPWIRAAAIWLASGFVLVIAVVALLVRQLPKDVGP
jgi:cytochrome c biogenesis factor